MHTISYYFSAHLVAAKKEPMKLNEVRRPGWANPTSQEAQQKAGQPV
jgi:hypothetical protein